MTAQVQAQTRPLGLKKKGPRTFKTKLLPVTKQRSLAGKYAPWVQALALFAFFWAFLGWLNEAFLYWWDNPIWLNRYTEYAIILAFGLWRIRAEQNPYTRTRLTVLVVCVTVLWWIIPWLMPFFEPYLGFLGTQPTFPSLHTPGTLTFYLVLLAVLLFGRRIICGWNCPCVGIRETVGFPFRHVTPRGPTAWKLRHLKWILFSLYFVSMGVLLFPPNAWSATFMGIFSLLIILPYFASMWLSPVIGNRGYCRFLCPYGATFGLLNKVGFYRIDFNEKTCTDCNTCTHVCDMGIPVLQMAKDRGKVDTVDCMGCGRCVTECPSGSLAFHDVRNALLPARRDRNWLRDWATGATPVARRHAMVFAALMVALLAGSWGLHAVIGTPDELSTTMWASLCIAP